MSWWSRWKGLRAAGVLGMNARNAGVILDYNPRTRFPYVDSKRKMDELCRKIGVPTPDLYAVLVSHSALRHLPRILDKHPEFVVKPNRGAGGRGVLVITGRKGPDYVRHNGTVLQAEDLRQHVSGVVSGLFSLGGNEDEALIQQRVVPDPVLEKISYQGTADIRVIVYRGEPVMAMLRLPTKASGGRANLHQGAIGAGVDIATGVTHHAVLKDRKAEIHPDTKESVIGFQVPYWSDILEMSRRVSRAVEMGYIGVDIVLDRARGPLLLEANARPGLAIQISNARGIAPELERVDRQLSQK
ncbi:alpha-l-glutamate ligase : ATP-grasp domain protein OS=Piscirickettsia salmonis LF-89 = ATCC VR-1361 GN=K661_01628 PE=4 SV=1: ATPgrasp_ST [Gemmata massiliana]|uniref:ATP-grasp domain-containing protein n=1 Tax=Gemmata massiliana TaxID=1210884 RepID=A0A6P2D0Q7_9BACT|nr:alpha-L-glutamate ligase-like protein [Gemmata massiliana]VTR94703.1 alpha-l-glutamate ligase : ATP-grasp domain protein OS=Piscirickettsia salmonis LF-89 = ATCC VR-1361 GN=K661_01628 PE=4 SV=1: ATPgrasp_ST [Gemmata massiliana]